ncbi:FliM/FliN family flagellar motor switch protein [Sansalvadorimonas sp. 2012CJ34-2]|uniref:FliM/FliN family flagellar motor switch protein n=1 Tax=Parendozoicomonas callyspongiae TaxID=2942213 RepID=A0ABT0PDT9_9GAMM|nr:FliM/FliN family flagellar motor switch protein [Sansalvadorimonas sp. 2012CJ34-2]MCL6269538.1 FliM/FliN family flagellar motor switch protein [Sansalvadorimonas sp. 2012CJ34-2]
MSNYEKPKHDSFSLIRSAVSMQRALQVQHEISEKFKEQVIAPFVEMLDCSVKVFELESIDFYQSTLSTLSSDKIIFRFSIQEGIYGFIFMGKNDPGNMVDLYYGGNGGIDYDHSAMSKAEQKLIKDIATILAGIWKASWSHWIDILEKSPSMILHLPKLSEPLIVSRFVYQLGSYDSELLIAMPAFYISAAVSGMLHSSSATKKHLFQNIQQVRVPVHAELARQWISVRQLNGMAPGDIFPINWPDIAYLRSQQSLLHKARPAIKADMLVLEITDNTGAVSGN